MTIDVEMALRNLLAYSSDCVWRRDAENYGGCWANDSEWRLMGAVTKGRNAIKARWQEAMQPFDRVWQTSHNIVFAFDRSRPAARSYLEETLFIEGGPVSKLLGVYHDTYCFEDGRWRFATRHIDIGYLGPVDLSATLHPMIDHGPGAYDPDPTRCATPDLTHVLRNDIDAMR